MTKSHTIPVVLATLLACAGCAGRVPPKAAEASAAPAESAPARPPASPPLAPPPVTGTGSANQPASPAPGAPASNPPAATGKAPADAAPPATASTYVFAPQQAVTASPAASAAVAAVSPPRDKAPAAATPPAGTPPNPDAPGGTPPEAAPPGELQLVVVASAPQVGAGEVVTVDVMAQSSASVVDAPLHLTFDPRVVEFVDSAPGDFLTQGGSSVVFFADGQSRPGDVAIAVGRVVREEGASGSGLLCRVHLRGVGPGTTPVLVGRAMAWDTGRQALTVHSSGTTVAVR